MNLSNVPPIVCGTDFSDPAQHAANVAAELAKRLGTRLLLVHGIDERGEIPAHHWPRMIAEDRPRLTAEGGAFSMLKSDGEVRVVHIAKPATPHDSHVAQLRELIPAEASECGIRTDVSVIENRDAAAGICEAADRFGADLICIGSHGYSRLLGAAMDSVAQEVIARSSRPVLVVRRPSS